MTMQLGNAITLQAGHDDAIAQVTAVLKDAGFGVLTRIDLHEAFREKLGVDYHPHTILGACNPPLAHQAITADPTVGLLLPCNVTVEQTEAGAVVRVVDPEAMLASGGGASDAVARVARDATARLRTALAALSG